MPDRFGMRELAMRVLGFQRLDRRKCLLERTLGPRMRGPLRRERVLEFCVAAVATRCPRPRD